jgi:hypothetical protein
VFDPELPRMYACKSHASKIEKSLVKRCRDNIARLGNAIATLAPGPLWAKTSVALDPKESADTGAPDTEVFRDPGLVVLCPSSSIVTLTRSFACR